MINYIFGATGVALATLGGIGYLRSASPEFGAGLVKALHLNWLKAYLQPFASLLPTMQVTSTLLVAAGTTLNVGQYEINEGAVPALYSPLAQQYDEFEFELEHGQKGRFVQNAPEEMYLGKSETITVRMSKDLKDDRIFKGMIGPGAPRGEAQATGSWMAVTAKGKDRDAFSVQSDSPNPQPIPKVGYAEWYFDVKPLEEGDQTLIFITTDFHDPSGAQKIGGFPVLHKVHVKVELWHRIDAFLDRIDFWKWLLPGIVGAIFLPIGGFFLKRWWERRTKSRPRAHAHEKSKLSRFVGRWRIVSLHDGETDVDCAAGKYLVRIADDGTGDIRAGGFAAIVDCEALNGTVAVRWEMLASDRRGTGILRLTAPNVLAGELALPRNQRLTFEAVR